MGVSADGDHSARFLRQLKAGGVDFLAIYPDSELAPIQRAALRDEEFVAVQVASEINGVSVCAGAWLGGRRPALFIPTAGLVAGTWPLVSLCMAKAIPLLLLINFRGEVGDAVWYMAPYQRVTTRFLDVLGIPYLTVDSHRHLDEATSRGMTSAVAWQVPVALLLARQVITGEDGS